MSGKYKKLNLKKAGTTRNNEMSPLLFIVFQIQIPPATQVVQTSCREFGK
jgi:hypothetical protein